MTIFSASHPPFGHRISPSIQFAVRPRSRLSSSSLVTSTVLVAIRRVQKAANDCAEMLKSSNHSARARASASPFSFPTHRRPSRLLHPLVIHLVRQPNGTDHLICARKADSLILPLPHLEPNFCLSLKCSHRRPALLPPLPPHHTILWLTVFVPPGRPS